MFDPLFTGLAWLVSAFYALIPNYAIAIALLTITVMLILFPLNAKAVRSQAALTKLQPELKRIQQKYKDDPQQQNAEVMALFKEHGTSPFGCALPMLVQMPVLFIMYQVLRGLTNRGEDGTFDPKYLDQGSELYQRLHTSKTMNAFGIDLAETASKAVEQSFVHAIPFLILIAGVVAAGYWQQAMISRRNPQQNIEDNPMAKQMQTMTRIFPLMYLVFGFTLPAGLNVYFLTSSLFRIAQQWLIYRMHPELLPGRGNPPAAPAASRDVTPKKPTPNGGNGAAKSIESGRVTAGASAPRQRSKKKKKR
ncbi:MAG TPA: YidC/Oxa1 family membrane protein insertase [Acidimicrobiales bacterium]|jgi:YidC/Oxa1 family membrane protein insertase|nr:YidC/Oxa1 family membrane protein insertase [Acidimicrobiales bacterium]